MKDFYLTLVSNSSMKYYSDNRTNCFTVHLPQYINLNGPWKVALVEIHYPFTFFNITNHNNSVFINYNSDKEDTHIVKLETGCYDNINDLLLIINKLIESYTNNEQFITYDYVTKRLKINDIFVTNNEKSSDNVIARPEKPLFSISFEGRLAMQLGFAPNENIISHSLSPHAVNLGLGVPEEFLVYCDIVESQIIGDTSSKVLRIINTVSGEKVLFGQSCHKEFNPPHYIEVNEKKIEKVSIDIRDMAGNYLPFQFGVLTIKLHFKQQQQN